MFQLTQMPEPVQAASPGWRPEQLEQESLRPELSEQPPVWQQTVRLVQAQARLRREQLFQAWMLPVWLALAWPGPAWQEQQAYPQGYCPAYRLPVWPAEYRKPVPVQRMQAAV